MVLVLALLAQKSCDIALPRDSWQRLFHKRNWERGRWIPHIRQRIEKCRPEANLGIENLCSKCPLSHTFWGSCWRHSRLCWANEWLQCPVSIWCFWPFHQYLGKFRKERKRSKPTVDDNIIIFRRQKQTWIKKLVGRETPLLKRNVLFWRDKKVSEEPTKKKNFFCIFSIKKIKTYQW